MNWKACSSSSLDSSLSTPVPSAFHVPQTEDSGDGTGTISSTSRFEPKTFCAYCLVGGRGVGEEARWVLWS